MVLSNGNMAWVMRSYSVRGGDPRSVEGGAVEEGQKREHPRCATERGTSEVDDQQKGEEREKERLDHHYDRTGSYTDPILTGTKEMGNEAKGEGGNEGVGEKSTGGGQTTSQIFTSFTFVAGSTHSLPRFSFSSNYPHSLSCVRSNYTPSNQSGLYRRTCNPVPRPPMPLAQTT